MRRRVVREVGTVFGIAIILAGLVLANDFWRRGDLAKSKVAERLTAEAKREAEAKRDGKGLDLLKWPIIQKTKGGYRTGPTFAQELMAYDGRRIDLVGFQVPLEQFRNMSEFILLPMPIECYFCQQPPMKDVVLVDMQEGEKAPLVKEPVVINGLLELHQGPKTQFFYVIRDAKWGPGDPTLKSTQMHRKTLAPEHMVPHNKPEQLLEGTEPPKAEPVSSTPAVIPPATPAPAPPAAIPAPASTATPAPAPAPDGSVTPPPSAPAAVPTPAPAPAESSVAPATPAPATAPTPPAAPAPAIPAPTGSGQ